MPTTPGGRAATATARMSSSYVDQRVTLESCGQTINYVKAGDGPCVTLLLPGALGTVRSDMITLLDGLNSRGRLTLVAWDPPGYGASRPPERTWDGMVCRGARMEKKVFFTYLSLSLPDIRVGHVFRIMHSIQ